MPNGSFFKGEKKKKKKGSSNQSFHVAPVFVPPTVIRKDKDRY